MTEVTEHAVALGVLRAAYPGRFPDETVRVYMRLLADVPADLLTRAVEDELRGGEREFLPTIAALRRRAVENALQLPHPEQAWQLVRTTDRRTPQPAAVLEARNSVGDAWYWRNGDEQYLRRDFLTAYTAIRERAISNAAAGDMAALARGPEPLALPATTALKPRSFMTWDGLTPITDEMKHDAILALRDLPDDHPAHLAAFHLLDMCGT